KRRSPWIDKIFIIAIVVMTSVAFILIMNVMKNPKDQGPIKQATHEIIPEPKQEVAVESITSSYPGIKEFVETANGAQYPFTIHYPQTEYDGFNQRVLDYVEELKTTYATEQKKNNRVSKLDVSFETLQHLSGNYSFVMRAVTYLDRKSTRLNSSHVSISYAVFCLKK